MQHDLNATESTIYAHSIKFRASSRSRHDHGCRGKCSCELVSCFVARKLLSDLVLDQGGRTCMIIVHHVRVHLSRIIDTWVR